MSCVIPHSEIGIELGLQIKVILTVSGRELRNSTRRDRDRARLANKIDTDREQHLFTRRDRARIRRQNLNRNTYNHLTEDNIAQDGPIASIIHINNGRIPDPFTLGLRDRPCFFIRNAFDL